MGQPSGVVSFLFTHIEGSTAAWEVAPAEMASALAHHDAILRAAIEDHGGYIFATGGDGFAAAFAAADDALAAAVSGQRALRAEAWPTEALLRVRMGLHSGTSIERDGDYFGPNVNRAARVMAAAHGRQIVASATTRALIDGSGLDAVSFEDAGVHRLKGLERPEPLVHVVVDGEGGFPPVRALESDLNNLPVARTSFVGREEEFGTLGSMVAERSLVTIVGPGGSGKTRLALAHASSITDCADGVWFVDLSDLDREGSVAEAVLTAVGLSADGLGREAVTAAAEKIAGWNAIIVLDNCEQVIDAAAEMAEELLNRCPNVALLATSREPLAVDGEHLLRIAGLGATRGDDSRLFVERVRLTDPRFQPSAADIATIADVCADLDHMPLAIELAAAKAAQLGMGDLVAGLLSASPDRRQRRRRQRHRSLGEVVQWSLDLMTEPERRGLQAARGLRRRVHARRRASRRRD